MRVPHLYPRPDFRPLAKPPLTVQFWAMLKAREETLVRVLFRRVEPAAFWEAASYAQWWLRGRN